MGLKMKESLPFSSVGFLCEPRLEGYRRAKEMKGWRSEFKGEVLGGWVNRTLSHENPYEDCLLWWKSFRIFFLVVSFAGSFAYG